MGTAKSRNEPASDRTSDRVEYNSTFVLVSRKGSSRIGTDCLSSRSLHIGPGHLITHQPCTHRSGLRRWAPRGVVGGWPSDRIMLAFALITYLVARCGFDC